MMEPEQRLLAELEAVLRRFPLRHMAEHAMPDFAARMDWCVRVLQRSRLPVRSATLAPVLCDRARSLRLDAERLQSLIYTMQLKSVALSETHEWYACALAGHEAPDEAVRRAVALAPLRVQESLRRAWRGTGRNVEVYSQKMGEWLYMCVHAARADGQPLAPLYVATQSAASFLFTGRRGVPARTADAIAVGLGWTRAVPVDLSGRHLQSLLRVLQQDINGPTSGLLSLAPYAPQLKITSGGVRCLDIDYDLQYAKSIVGAEPPRIGKLVGRSRQPFCDLPDSAPLAVTVAVECDDVAAALREMVRAKVIAPDSAWLHLFRSTTTTGIDFDVER